MLICMVYAELHATSDHQVMYEGGMRMTNVDANFSVFNGAVLLHVSTSACHEVPSSQLP